MRAPLTLALVLALAACAPPPRAGPAPTPAPVEQDARAVLDTFTAALEAGRWEAAYALLSARWRARETPARLAADLASSGEIGQDALRRARALLAAGARPIERDDRAELIIGRDQAARLVREGHVWRVDALE